MGQALRVMCLGLCAFLLAQVPVAADSSVVGFRGDGSGRYADARPVLQWSAEQNVVWLAATKKWSNACPLVVGDRIFIGEEPTTLLCLRASDSKELWRAENDLRQLLTPEQAAAGAAAGQPIRTEINELRKQQNELRKQLRQGGDKAALGTQMNEVGKKIADAERRLRKADPTDMPATHGDNGYSSCTPVSDGKRVFALYGNGVVAAYDLDGKRLWIKSPEKPNHGWGQSASPALIDGKLIVHIQNVLALNPDSGEEIWRAPSSLKWGTPVGMKVGNLPVVISAMGDVMRASDGKVLVRKINDLPFNTPLIDGDKVYFISGKSVAVRLLPEGDDNVKVEKLWETKINNERYYASPLLHEGLIYAITRTEVLTVLDAADGATVYEKQMQFSREGGPNRVYTSPTLGGQHVFLNGMEGHMVILKPGREYVEVGRNTLDGTRTSPVFIGDRMYLRTFKGLYCIGDNRRVSAE